METWKADLCFRCAGVWWDCLRNDGQKVEFRSGRKQACEDHETLSCRVCRLIKLAMPRFCEFSPSGVDLMWDSGFGHTSEHVLGSLTFRAKENTVETVFGHLILSTKDSIEELDVKSTFPPMRIDFSEIRGWLKECAAAHPPFQAEMLHALVNLRVIDCITKSIVVAPAECSYVALSYVWGQLVPASHNMGSPVVLPPTVEDAVSVTLKLGYRYLWVDRYCINQDDPQDRKRQISQMGLIYGSAQLTIIAAAGEDPSYGLAGVSRDRMIPSGSESLNESQFLHIWPMSVECTIGHSPWYSRAWTLQEGLLSNRTLCFSESGVLFNCKSDAHQAGFTKKEHDVGDRSGCNMYETTTVAERIVRTGLGLTAYDIDTILDIYAQRILRHDLDALSAIIGTLNIVRQNHEIYHIWGVPFGVVQAEPHAPIDNNNDVLISLNWQHCESGARRRHGFPSWSSLGWIGNITHQGTRNVRTTSDFMIKYWSGSRYQELDSATCSLDYTPSRGDPPPSQYLQITAYAIETNLEKRWYYSEYQVVFVATFLRFGREEKEVLFLPCWDDPTTLDVAVPVLCVPTTRPYPASKPQYPPDVPPGIVSIPWTTWHKRKPFLLFFQKRAGNNYYERIGACGFELHSMNTDGRVDERVSPYWEFVPSGEEGYWDQVAKRRTFIVR